VEAFLYLVFPFIGARLARLSFRKTLLVVLSAWLIPSGLACAYQRHWISTPVWRAYVTNNPLLWLPLFVIGICATRMLPVWRNVEPSRAALISTSAFVALIFAALFWPRAYGDVFVTGGIAPLLAAVILSFTRLSSPIARMIGGRVLNRLGEASYVIYIIQAPVWHYWQQATDSLRRFPAQANLVAPWQFLLFFPLLILVSLAVQRLVENPIRAGLAKWNRTSFIEETHALAMPAESRLLR
jgi:peptidoglycan/LPS O-acetylase OafA/YrhL